MIIARKLNFNLRNLEIVIISSRYPSLNNPYNHMFVHARAVEFKNKGLLVSVYIPSSKNGNYVYENINVKKRPSIKIIKEISKNSIVYLHLLNIYPFSKANGWPIYKHLMINNIPFAMYVHGNEVQKYSSRLFEFNYKLTDILKWVKKDWFVIPKMKKFVSVTKSRSNVSYVFPSNWMKESLEYNLKLKLNKFTIIPNGIDTNYFQYNNTAQNKFKILTIRSLSQKVYNIEQTINIMSKLPDNYILVIYGEGSYRKKYEKKIAQNGLENRVKIINKFLEKEQMREVFKDYGMFISTTRMDSQGITMMEAMASGLIVITTNNSSKKEFIINLENGILGSDNDDIIESILKISKSEELYKSLSINGRNSIENIDIKITSEKELIMLKKLVN